MNKNQPAPISSLGILVVGLIIVATPGRAHAYLDPGTGSVVLQVVVAGVLGAIFTLKSYLRALVSYVSRLFGKKGSTSDA